MNKDQLKARIAEIEKAMTQLVGNHSMLNGQLQECKFWLSKVEEQETEGRAVYDDNV